jgi:hypothetical protein
MRKTKREKKILIAVVVGMKVRTRLPINHLTNLITHFMASLLMVWNVVNVRRAVDYSRKTQSEKKRE